MIMSARPANTQPRMMPSFEDEDTSSASTPQVYIINYRSALNAVGRDVRGRPLNVASPVSAK